MSHPNREEWISFVYEDMEANEQKRLAAHLRECETCRQRVERFRSTMQSLDQWALPALPPRPRARQPWVRWAAAAALVLAAGILIGAAARPKLDLEGLRASIEPGVRAQIQERLAAEMRSVLAESRERDQAAFLVTLQKLEQKRSDELRALRQDLETVAALTEVNFRSAQSQLVRLAGYNGSVPE